MFTTQSPSHGVFLPAARQVLIRANTKLSDADDKYDEPSAALSAAEAVEACGSGSVQQTILLDAVPEGPTTTAAAAAAAVDPAHG